jgi:hypothetical protein
VADRRASPDVRKSIEKADQSSLAAFSERFSRSLPLYIPASGRFWSPAPPSPSRWRRLRRRRTKICARLARSRAVAVVLKAAVNRITNEAESAEALVVPRSASGRELASPPSVKDSDEVRSSFLKVQPE